MIYVTFSNDSERKNIYINIRERKKICTNDKVNGENMNR